MSEAVGQGTAGESAAGQGAPGESAAGKGTAGESAAGQRPPATAPTVTERLHFLPLELARWDAVEGGAPLAEAIAFGFFVDERPLRGAAGLCDWRLGGRLSRLLKSGRLCGAEGETTVLPPAGRRLAFPRLFLFGLGESTGWDDGRYRTAVRRVRSVLRRAGLSRYALQPPGRATGLIAARRALELWLEEAERDRYGAEVTILETSGGQKEMAEALRARAKAG